MSLFDRFVSVLKGATPRVKDPGGPLDLSPGDLITYYREKLVVSGIRILTTEGPLVFQYCLKDDVGRKSVLVAIDDGERPELSLQRFTDHDVKWEAETVNDFEDETYTFRAEGQARLQHIGDTWMRGCRMLDFRVLDDESGDQLLVLEDYNGQRETRLGEPLFEGEFGIVRGERPEESEDTGEVISEVPSGTAEVEIDAARGSPLAAALALSKEQPEEPSQEISESEDEWSDAYDDDDWADAEYDDRPIAKRAPKWTRVKAAPAKSDGETAEISSEVPESVFETVVDDAGEWDFI